MVTDMAILDMDTEDITVDTEDIMVDTEATDTVSKTLLVHD